MGNILMFDDKPHNIRARQGIAAGVPAYNDWPDWKDIVKLLNDDASRGFKQFIVAQYRDPTLEKFTKAMMAEGHYTTDLRQDMSGDRTVDRMITQINAFVEMSNTDADRKQCPKCHGKSAADPEIDCSECRNLGSVPEL